MKSKKSLTQVLISSRKYLLYIILALAILVDGFITFDLLFNAKVALQYVIIPLIMCVCDVIYFVSSFFTNYRFKYSLAGIISYISILFSGSVACLVLYAWNGNNVVMTTLSWVSFLLIHLIIVAIIIYGIVISKKYFKKSIVMPVIGSSIISIIFSVLFLSLVQTNGAFGQIYIEEGRVISYTYDEKRDGYIVSDLLKGRGNTIVVPETFNEKKVIEFDMKVLTDSQIRAVKFEKGTKNISFVNSIALNSNFSHLSDINLLAEKEEINQLKENLLFSVSSTDIQVMKKNNVIQLFNSFYPTNLTQDEIFVSFQYDENSYIDSKGDILQSLVIPKGQKMSIDSLNYIDYVKYSNQNNESHLCWNYENNNGKMMKPLVDSNNNSIFDVSISKDLLNIKVDFENVYKILIEDDNDTLYEIDESYKSTILDNDKYEYRYTLIDNAQNVLNSIPGREGFTLKWEEGRTTVSDLSLHLSSKNNNSPIRMYPKWILNTPTISSIYSNNLFNQFTYGDNVRLSCEHEEVASGIKYKYEWSHGAEKMEEQYPFMENVLPSQSGTYNLKITAYSDYLTSLTSQATDALVINIEKKDLDFIWTLPDDLIYNAQEKEVTCTFDTTQVINEDTITFALENNKLVDAGRYVSMVHLTEDCALKYKIPSMSQSKNVEIYKRPVTAIWDTNTTFTYDGENHYVPILSLNNYVNEEENDIIDSIVYSKEKNAGAHKVKATINHPNYCFENEETSLCDFEILKRDIEIVFEPFTKVYDGLITPSSEYVYQVNNLASSDNLEQVLTIKYQGSATTAKDVGTYPFEVNYLENELFNNYNVDIDDTNGVLIINKRNISLTWDKNSFIYNAKEQHPIVTMVDNSVEYETQDIVDSLIYSGGKVDVGSNYQVQASLNLEFDKNYSIVSTTSSHIYSINKKDMSIIINDVTKTYDKLTHNDFSYVVSGIEGEDLEEEIFSSSFIGNATTAVDVGTYDINLSATYLAKASNYNISIEKGTLTINKRNVKLIWFEDNSYVYDGMIKVYPVINVQGAVEGDEDNLLSNLNYEIGNIHVGTYTQTVYLMDQYSKNYNIIDNTNKGTYYITPKDATITIDDTSKIYDGNPSSGFTHIVNGLASTDVASEVFTYKYSDEATTATNVGNYDIGITLTSLKTTSNGKVYNRLDDYNFTIEKGNAQITPREISLVWDSNTSKVYNGYEQGINVVSIDNVVSKDASTLLQSITYSNKNINVGTYNMEAKLTHSNYQVVEATRFKDYAITPKDLTITIQPATKTYDGTTTNSFYYSVSGLIIKDIQSEVFILSYSGEAITAVNAGTYQINAYTHEMDKYNNYSISIVPSTLTINPRTISVIWSSNRTFEYNGLSQGVEATGFTSVIEKDKVDLLESLVYNEGKVNVGGPYYREVSTPNSNYVLTNKTCTYNISPRIITIKVNDVTKVYDGNVNNSFSYTALNVASTDVDEEIFTISYSGLATTAVNVGNYTINASYTLNTSSKGSNYTISITKGTLTITPREISLIWDPNNTFLYTGESFGIEVIGVNNAVGDVDSIISKITYNAKQSQIGSYIRVANLNNSNYVIRDGSDSMDYFITSNPLS